MSVYLDASVLLPMVVQEVSSGAVDDYLRARSEELLVSDFAAAEVASALSRLVRTKKLSDSAAIACLDDFDAWRFESSTPADVHAADVRLAAIFVFDLMLRTPDALHVAIAKRLDSKLATLDRRLAFAARDLGATVEEIA